MTILYSWNYNHPIFLTLGQHSKSPKYCDPVFLTWGQNSQISKIWTPCFLHLRSTFLNLHKMDTLIFWPDGYPVFLNLGQNSPIFQKLWSPSYPHSRSKFSTLFKIWPTCFLHLRSKFSNLLNIDLGHSVFIRKYNNIDLSSEVSTVHKFVYTDDALLLVRQ